MASVELRGMAELQRKLGELEAVVEQLADPTKDALELLSKRLQLYPPPPPGSTYDRTGALRNSWQETLVMSSTVLGIVYNNIDYGPFVQDAEEQAGIHQGRWQTTQSVLEEEEGNIVGLYERHLEELINK
jgi:hypothetical protein